ncbi:MAG: ribosome biogenesis GTPase YlqF [Clostridia bacterium]|nr:ribosome biogenesis GTPase YlqF [Clostridia bacterium]
MNINWYPGHMAKTRRLITENLKLVDIVVELLDARIPHSSKNPDIDNIVNNKPRLAVFNKVDLADDKVTEEWIKYYKEKNINVVCINARDGKGTEKISTEINKILSEKINKYTEKGMNYNIKMMIVGIPNVGKSSLINKLAKKSSAKTGDKPGVTKGKQWVRIQKGLELLDTPGILWPKFEDPEVGKNLALTGAIKDEILDTLELSCMLLNYLKREYPDNLKERYKVEFDKDIPDYDLLLMIGKKRGFIISGGEIDDERTAKMLLDETRGLKLGKISFEKPYQSQNEES